MVYFISYDIANSKRLSRVSRLLQNFGIRIQYSFFECEMEKSQLEVLKEALLKIINKKQDSIRIYPICEDCIRETSTLGEGDIFVPKNFLIL